MPVNERQAATSQTFAAYTVMESRCGILTERGVELHYIFVCSFSLMTCISMRCLLHDVQKILIDSFCTEFKGSKR